MPYPPSLPQGLSETLAALRRDATATWLCQSLEGDAPTIRVQGWTGLVRRLAMDCLDVAASSAALDQAEAWLLEDGTWHFGEGGVASWRIALPDGAWAATLIPAGHSLDEAKRTLLS